MITNKDYLTFSTIYSYRDTSGFTALVNTLLQSFNTNYELGKVQEFLNKHPDLDQSVATNQAFKQNMENIIINIRWLNSNIMEIDKWLRDNSQYYGL